MELTTFAEDPAALDARGTGSIALAVGEDEHAVPPAAVLGVVGQVGGGVEVGATGAHALGRHHCAAAPLVHVLVEGFAVERKNVDGNLLGERTKFREELGEHLVGDGAGLIDRDEQFGFVATLRARVDVGVALVDALHRVGAPAADQLTDELTEDLAPVDDVGHRFADGVNQLGGHISPAVSLRVCGLDGFLDDRLDLALHVLLDLVGEALPGAVVVQRTESVHRGAEVGVVLRLFVDFLEVPLRGLHGRQLSDDLSQLHRSLLVLGPVASFGVLEGFAGNKCELGQLPLAFEVIGTGAARIEDDGVDRQVSGDVPQLRRRLLATVQVAEDEVVKLVREHASDLTGRQRGEELRVPVQDEVVPLLVEGNSRRGHVFRGDLRDVARQLREERRVLQERHEMSIQVEVGLASLEHVNTIPRCRVKLQTKFLSMITIT